MRGSLRPQLIVAGCLLAGVLLGGFSLHRFWQRELSHVTGDAQWVWVTDALERVHPAAGLFVASLRLDTPPGAALLKVCGDREYVVYVNGTAAACGWNRPGFALDLFDVGHLLRQGENLIAAEVRSPTPAGGLVLALDVAGVGTNVLVTGRDFTYRPRFSLAAHDPADRPVPVRWGSPPRYPWGYPTPVSHPRTLPESVVEDPVIVRRTEAHELPGGGLEFRLPRPVTGYLWLRLVNRGAMYMTTLPGERDVGLDALRSTAQPVVAIPGQTRWLDPQPRSIGSVFTFGLHSPVAIEVWPLPDEFSSGAPGDGRGTSEPVQRTRWTTRNPPG